MSACSLRAYCHILIPCIESSKIEIAHATNVLARYRTNSRGEKEFCSAVCSGVVADGKQLTASGVQRRIGSTNVRGTTASLLQNACKQRCARE